jgi:mono/diheme cytochrome c family protein
MAPAAGPGEWEPRPGRPRGRFVARALAGGIGILALGIAIVVAAMLLAPMPAAPRGPEPGRTLYVAHCAGCHGADGRGGSWRARLLLLRPGNLAAPAAAALPDQYLIDLIRHGGSSFGKPGMPSFGFVLSDEEILALVKYLRTLPPAPPPPRA